MTGLSGAILNTRLWAFLCLGSLGAMIALSIFGNAIAPRIWSGPDELNRAGRVVLPTFGVLFLVLGFSAVPLMTNLLVSGLDRMWADPSLQHPLHPKILSFLRQHQVHIVAGMWSVFVVGLAIAGPHAIRMWAEDPDLPWRARPAPAGAMPPLEHQVRHARQILMLNTVIEGGVTRYLPLRILKQEAAVVQPGASGLLDIDTTGFQLLGYTPAHDRWVVMFFSQPDATGKTLFELLLPAPDGTMRYPAYRAPPDPTIDRVLTVDELGQMVLSQAAPAPLPATDRRP